MPPGRGAARARPRDPRPRPPIPAGPPIWPCSAPRSSRPGAARGPPRPPTLERLRIFEAVVEAIAWSAEGALTLVLLEDFHRADPASLALLGHAGRRIGDLRALIVVTRRQSAEGEVDRALEAVRRQEGALTEVALGPLDADAIASIVGDAAPGLSGEKAARVAQRRRATR